MGNSLILIALIITHTLNGQVHYLPFNTAYNGIGAYSTNFIDVFSGTANHASTADLDQAGVAVFGERRFMLKELSNFIGIVAIPLKSGVISIQGNFFGTSLNNESELGFSYARKISDKINVGVKFNSYTFSMSGYGSARAITGETSIIYHISDHVHMGFQIYNPVGGKLGKNSSQKLPYIYKYGLGYELSPLVFITGEIEKQENQSININAGLQYNLHKKLFIRAGIATRYNRSFIASGIYLGFARIDITTSYHPQLGLTPGLLLLINMGKDNKN